MGIAWVDDGATDEQELDLRWGGRPLLPQSQPWPTCPDAGTPMLFRGQIPLALTSLASPLDDRMLAVFECHHHVAERSTSPCHHGAVLILPGSGLALRDPPRVASYDVVLSDPGDQPQALQQTLSALDLTLPTAFPAWLLDAVPPSLADATVAALSSCGAKAEVRASPPMVLPECVGGRMVPFEAAERNARTTTLPPLEQLLKPSEHACMRGVLGGTVQDGRHSGVDCRCGQQARIAAQLFACPTSDPRIELGSAYVVHCSHCGATWYARSKVSGRATSSACAV